MRILKLRNLLVLAALGSLVTFSSCDGDDDGTPPQPNLTLTANSDSVQAVAGDTISFEVNVNHEKDLESFTVAGNPPTRVDTSISGIGSQGFNYQFSYVVPGSLGAGTEVDFTFTVTDEDQESASQEYKVIVTQSGSALNEYTAIMMGADRNSEFGSFYSTSENNVYKVSGVNGENSDNRSLVDFIFYYGDDNNASIAAPSDETATVFDVYNVQNWSDNERNGTNFSTSVGLSFSEVSSDNINQVRSAVEGGNNTLAKKLSEGDVVGFITESGNAGAFRVDEISVPSSSDRESSIELSVKVE